MGTLPGEAALRDVPRVRAEDGGASTPADPAGDDSDPAIPGGQVASLMSLLQQHVTGEPPPKLARVWLGEGLGSVTRKIHDRMRRWEYVELGELGPKAPTDRADARNVVVLPGFEVSQVKPKPVQDIITWSHCYARYSAVMAKEDPGCTPGFMAHLLTVLKAYTEVEGPAWRLYDEAYREKMAATVCKRWAGMDVQLYQEVCGGRPRRRAVGEGRYGGGPAAGEKRVREERQGKAVCWQYNGSGCRFKACKFPHRCEWCLGPHPRSRCPEGQAGKRGRQ